MTVEFVFGAFLFLLPIGWIASLLLIRLKRSELLAESEMKHGSGEGSPSTYLPSSDHGFVGGPSDGFDGADGSGDGGD